MSKKVDLKNYSDKELLAIMDADIEKEMKSRGYEYGWHKQINYAGEIYILINPAFPSLVKIGYADNVEKRIKTLNSSSGVPDPYHVFATYKVKKRLEDLKLHKLMDTLDSDLRHAKNKEFYEMTPQKAYGILSAIAQINGDEELLVLNPANDQFISNIIKEYSSEKKKSKLTFALLGIPVGSQLVYKDDTSIIVTTADKHSSVKYKGKAYTMSGLVKHLKNGGSWQGGEYFLYDGKKLTELRKEIEGDSL